MHPMRTEDNSSKKKEEFLDSIPHLAQAVADRTLSQLEKDGVFVLPEAIRNAEDLEGNAEVLQSIDGNYRTGNVMGFLGLGEERLVISSRFSGKDGRDSFLQYMIARVFDLPNIIDLPTDASLSGNLFDYLALLLPRYLKRAMRKGPYKEYVRRLHNDANVRGAIDIARHIASNTPFVGKIAYSQRELSYDNDLMELVRHTIEVVRGRTYGEALLSRARDEVALVKKLTPGFSPRDTRRVIEANRKHPVRHAYYRDYRSLQRLCLLILQNRKHLVGTSDQQIYGVLFDGAWLWEEYVATLMRDAFYHPKNKGRGKERNGQQLFWGEESREKGLIFPDFIGRDSEVRVIADAKYKPASNISGRDYQQLLAYMFRFDAKTGYYLYPFAPEKEKAQDVTLHLNRGSTFEENVEARKDIVVKKRGLQIPSGDCDFKEFAKRMRESEGEFLV
ncbi:MAG: hypothetical protein KHY83_11750 [Coriobacteriia bacterium]|nr:hypothetical protein [Coriobacteriia bacterium]MBS5479320.1 hypothetical protein [Coriobacteriia bacterium]